MNIRELFATKRPTTAAAIGKAISELDGERERLGAVLLDLAGKRVTALIDSGDAEVDRVEREQAATCRSLDRCDAALAELRSRLEAAEAAEGDAKERAARQAAEQHGAEAVRLAAEYATKARELAEVRRAMRDADFAIAQFNGERAAAGHAPFSPVLSLAQRLYLGSMTLSPPAPPYATAHLPAPGIVGDIAFNDGRHFWSAGRAGDEVRGAIDAAVQRERMLSGAAA
jgi:hypothetical protein